MESMVERVAKVIDPEGFERYEEAYRRKDRFEQVQRIGRLVSAREKAKKILSALREPTPEMEEAADEPVHEALHFVGEGCPAAAYTGTPGKAQ